MNLKPMPLDYDKDPMPNPNPKTFHGKWTDWPEIHDQKSLDPKATYCLRLKGVIPEGGKPFYVELTHPLGGGDVTMTTEIKYARKFRGNYLLHTMWDWESKYDAHLWSHPNE